MGATIPKCILCGSYETENNPVLEVHSRGKRNGQSTVGAVLNEKSIKSMKKD